MHCAVCGIPYWDTTRLPTNPAKAYDFQFNLSSNQIPCLIPQAGALLPFFRCFGAATSGVEDELMSLASSEYRAVQVIDPSLGRSLRVELGASSDALCSCVWGGFVGFLQWAFTCFQMKPEALN